MLGKGGEGDGERISMDRDGVLIQFVNIQLEVYQLMPKRNTGGAAEGEKLQELHF